MAEWLKAADCKSVSLSFVGSNPTLWKRGRVNGNSLGSWSKVKGSSPFPSLSELNLDSSVG